MTTTEPTPIELHRRRLHREYGRRYEEAAYAKSGIVTGWRDAARFAWMLPVGVVLLWLGYKVGEAIGSGRFP